MKRVVNVLLQIFDLSSENTIVLAATNRLKDIDTALLRRFDLTINYKLP
jgi:SpoVK/Ycf46/Vps4 family AAA+-type ATPase